MTARQEILNAITALTADRDPPTATAQEILKYLQDQGTTYQRPTLTAHLYEHMKDVLERTDRGTFRIRQKSLLLEAQDADWIHFHRAYLKALENPDLDPQVLHELQRLLIPQTEPLNLVALCAAPYLPRHREKSIQGIHFLLQMEAPTPTHYFGAKLDAGQYYTGEQDTGFILELGRTLFKAARNGALSEEQFHALQQHIPVFNKATVACYFMNPEVYLPLNVYIERLAARYGVNVPETFDFQSWRVFTQALMERTGLKPFELMALAWKHAPELKKPVAAEKPPVKKIRVAPAGPATNLILYGPPGTGKTYGVVDEVLKLLSPEHLNSPRVQKVQVFEGLRSAGRVEFVTFHQSFTYEDFVEGIRAETTEDGQVRYVVRDGIFKTLSQRALDLLIVDEPQAQPAPESAATQGTSPEVEAYALEQGIDLQKTLWKISIQDGPTLSYCLDHNEVRVHFGHVGDLRHPTPKQEEQLQELKSRQHILRNLSTLPEGTLMVLSSGGALVDAVGVVRGPYHFDAHPPGLVHQDYQHVLPVRWLFKGRQESFFEEYGGNFNTFTLNPYLSTKVTPYMVLSRFLGVSTPIPESTEAAPHAPSCVLVIDEINRGNISRIFGELITLLEPSKRLGAAEQLTVRLPYSKEDFAVPGNLHIIGTMNTADRSLTQMDIALRRRFEFRELPPRPEVLPQDCAGVNVRRMLHAINRRIEVLFDRDHTIGHAYLMPLHENPTLNTLASIMQDRILPLLEEYFFEDWGRIRMVLADDQTSRTDEQFVLEVSEEETTLWVPQSRPRAIYRVNPEAFRNVSAYQKIYSSLPDHLFQGL
ncbi:AAA family ATPase [Deinococcus cellulosilyticus]|uniref:ATPase dynein-related AAA domain-containing protein n=1 Tax=Deinococcus cellulosilyticus (strain DSM 18568 / NBRC 106333 / KACC 11606 / 5516J-15) TaxID=1223518 RepID=A0A511N276_DEIC1|nr:AAA family ATPase [Deinococcus cellulosilyticus]GEM46953.1 hypothetical protein DC3_25880 [Deinococcus cellulosilyticus NBRC 106333 = KACC 11606]